MQIFLKNREIMLTQKFLFRSPMGPYDTLTSYLFNWNPKVHHTQMLDSEHFE
jgi:hypothetical protein